MDINYVFDIDGTLTPSRLQINPQFRSFFLHWIQDKKVYLITGSDYAKSLEQVGSEILERVTGCFNNAANVGYVHGKETYRKEWSPPPKLIAFLNQLLQQSDYPIRTSNHIEIRIGMLNFSIVGRDCTQDQRIAYFEFDKKRKERSHLCQKIMAKFPEYDAVIGGQISVDIYPRGQDKGQILSLLKGPIYFFGDQTKAGGNDYILAKYLRNSPHKVFQVSGWEETMNILKEFS